MWRQFKFFVIPMQNLRFLIKWKTFNSVQKISLFVSFIYKVNLSYPWFSKQKKSNGEMWNYILPGYVKLKQKFVHREGLYSDESSKTYA